MKIQTFKSFVLVMIIFILGFIAVSAEAQKAVVKDEQLLKMKNQINASLATFEGEIKHEKMQKFIDLVRRYEDRKAGMEKYCKLDSVCYINPLISNACLFYENGMYQSAKASLEGASRNSIVNIEAPPVEWLSFIFTLIILAIAIIAFFILLIAIFS